MPEQKVDSLPSSTLSTAHQSTLHPIYPKRVHFPGCLLYLLFPCSSPFCQMAWIKEWPPYPWESTQPSARGPLHPRKAHGCLPRQPEVGEKLLSTLPFSSWENTSPKPSGAAPRSAYLHSQARLPLPARVLSSTYCFKRRG